MTAAVALVGLFGGIVGSFLNVVIHRVPCGESVVTPRSRCPSCGRGVAPRDNVPVLSWILLRGRCRHCAKPISLRYPLVEALTAASFLTIVLIRGVDSDLAFELPFAAMLIAVAGIDLDHRIVPNKILLPVAAWGIVASAILRPGQLPELAIAAAASFLFLLVAALIRPGGMGMGDVKLAGTMGLYLGASVAPALLVAFAVGAGVGVAIMARHGAGARKRGVPFAPFLALGGLVGLLVGPELIAFYMTHFLA